MKQQTVLRPAVRVCTSKCGTCTDYERHDGAGDLALALDDYSVGDMVALKVLRGAGDSGSKELEVRLRLEEDML